MVVRLDGDEQEPMQLIWFEDGKGYSEPVHRGLGEMLLPTLQAKYPGAKLRPLDTIREADDDGHYYGPWAGGKASKGGGPVRGPDGSKGGMTLTEDEQEETLRVRGRPDNAHMKRGKDQRIEQIKEWDEKGGGPKDYWEREAYGAAKYPDDKSRYEERTVRAAQGTWFNSPTSPASALLQSSVAEAGIGGGMVWGGKMPTAVNPATGKPERAARPLLQPSEHSKAGARIIYERTQSSLAHSDRDTITLYRGVSGKRRPISESVASANVLESWATNATDAEFFAKMGSGGGTPTILKVTVPKAAIFMDMRYAGESEMVVLGSKIPRKTITVQKLEARPVTYGDV